MEEYTQNQNSNINNMWKQWERVNNNRNLGACEQQQLNDIEWRWRLKREPENPKKQNIIPSSNDGCFCFFWADAICSIQSIWILYRKRKCILFMLFEFFRLKGEYFYSNQKLSFLSFLSLALFITIDWLSSSRWWWFEWKDLIN